MHRRHHIGLRPDWRKYVVPLSGLAGVLSGVAVLIAVIAG
jgi:hypothetical protein